MNIHIMDQDVISFAISDGHVGLYNGTWNTPAGYSQSEIAGETVPGLLHSDWNKLKLEILPNAHVYGYVNDVLYIDYAIPDGVVPTGKFALVNSNSYNDYRAISSFHYPFEILWSTGETTQSIIVSPTNSKNYSVITEGFCQTWNDNITIIVNQPSDSIVNVNICDGDTFTFDETILSDEGTYFATFSNKNGCDSVVLH